MQLVKRKFYIAEDWAAVLMGFLVIAAVLSGFPVQQTSFNWNTFTDLSNQVLTLSNVQKIALQFFLTWAVVAAGALLTAKHSRQVILAFPILYFLVLIVLVLAGNAVIRQLNLESVIISLLSGLAISNFFQLPAWMKTGLSAEFYVKVGLVLLGSSIVFSDLLKSGSLGLIQALVVVVSVWYFAFWVSTRLRVDKEMAIMLSSAVSICGVAAAIAASGAIRGDAKKLSYVVSLVLITAIPMMIGMPYAAQLLGLSQTVTGAWLGGTIDTTGAVVASGTLVGEEALKISTVVKFSQNVLLGAAAFGIALYWSYRKENQDADAVRPGLKTVWERFPKFVLGFVAVSVLFSFVLPSPVTPELKGTLKALQGIWFTLAFFSIGLETSFRDLIRQSNRRPFYAFLIAQLFNIVLTLVIAYFLFDET